MWAQCAKGRETGQAALTTRTGSGRGAASGGNRRSKSSPPCFEHRILADLVAEFARTNNEIGQSGKRVTAVRDRLWCRRAGEPRTPELSYFGTVGDLSPKTFRDTSGCDSRRIPWRRIEFQVRVRADPRASIQP